MTMLESQKIAGEEAISLLDALIFLKRSWGVIAKMGVMGILVSIVYSAATPSQFQAATRITMLRFPAEKNSLGNYVEEPAALISRLSAPDVFDSSVIKACGFGEAPSASIANNQMAKLLKFSIPKGLPSVLEIKVNLSTPLLAKACVDGVARFINQSQIEIRETSTDFFQSSNTRLKAISEQLIQDRELLSRASTPNGLITPTYFLILSDIRRLEDEQSNILLKLEAAKLRPYEPTIISTDYPVYPKTTIILFAGFVSGLFLGLVFAIGRQALDRLRPTN